MVLVLQLSLLMKLVVLGAEPTPAILLLLLNICYFDREYNSAENKVLLLQLLLFTLVCWHPGNIILLIF